LTVTSPVPASTPVLVMLTFVPAITLVISALPAVVVFSIGRVSDPIGI
jgi:hypothetical protein